MTQVSLDIKVIGQEIEIVELLKVLGAIQYLGDVGSSRDIKVSVDGDGSGRLSFRVKVEGKFVDLPSTKIDTYSGDLTTKFYIGE
jgi:hypothetical protein